MKKVFIVKEKSANEFFKTYAVEFTASDRRHEDQNPYYFFKDEIIVKKSLLDLMPDERTIIFSLLDTGQMSRKSILNAYTYEVDVYDDLTLKLTLVNFQVIAS